MLNYFIPRGNTLNFKAFSWAWMFFFKTLQRAFEGLSKLFLTTSKSVLDKKWGITEPTPAFKCLMVVKATVLYACQTGTHFLA